MEPKFEKIPPFTLVGCPQFANPQELCPGKSWERLEKIKKIFNSPSPSVEFAIEVYPPDFPSNEFKFYYMAGLPLEAVSSEMRSKLFLKEIPEAEYAVFDVKDNNHENFVPAFKYAYNTWLPNSNYQASYGFDLERYTYHPEKSVQILIPVTSKGI